MNNFKPLKIAFVGCGSIGFKRASNLGTGGVAFSCFDNDSSKAVSFSKKFGCKVCESLEELLSSSEVDIVVVATVHNVLAEITTQCILSNKHVLVEKPAAKNSIELREVLNIANETGALVRIGFNHRFHQSIIKMISILDSGDLGDLMFMRGRYGHGGRLGYDKEWRSLPEISGGGELLDQGSHIIDLTNLILGPVKLKYGIAKTYYWDMEVDDNAFLLLENSSGAICQMHVSCTEWKNLFSLEVYGTAGKISLDGLGGSYGVERITLYKMLPEMGPPETFSWEYPGQDQSWRLEIESFYEDIRLKRQPTPGISEAISVLDIIGKVYDDK